MKNWQLVGEVLLILALGIFFRFYDLKEIPLGLYPDEAMNGNNALEALSSGDFKVFYPENNGREGLFINIQALSVKIFGNTPWALRGVSALLGSLTLLGIFFLARELFRTVRKRSENDPDYIALLATFLIATSYWHISLSRIGFRAIMLPLISSFGMYFLLKGFRRSSALDMIWAGIIMGLGFYTYIAFRFIPFVVAIPVGLELWKWFKNRGAAAVPTAGKKSCAPCLILLFIFVAFVVALPIGVYFLHHLEDFSGRVGQVSVFSAASPIREFIKSNILTAGMFFVHGDCNWRHNFPCRPELHSLVAVFFLIGILAMIRNTFKRNREVSAAGITLLGWLVLMSLPATLTREGLPHALRAIGLIPPVMLLAAYGGWGLGTAIMDWLSRQQERWPNQKMRILRIQHELVYLYIFILLTIPFLTYRVYFREWAQNPNTYGAFTADLWHLGEYLNALPAETTKYVIVNQNGTDVRGIPMPAQTVMYATNSFVMSEREKKHFHYILPSQIDAIAAQENKTAVIAFLDGKDTKLIRMLQKKFPQLKTNIPGDFLLLQNY